MNRFLAITLVAVALGWASSARAQVYTVYYPARPLAPVTTYYSPPQPVYYAPAPRVAYYAPPAVTYYRPTMVGRVTGWRYNPAPVVYRYPATTAYYYPAY